MNVNREQLEDTVPVNPSTNPSHSPALSTQKVEESCAKTHSEGDCSVHHDGDDNDSGQWNGGGGDSEPPENDTSFCDMDAECSSESAPLLKDNSGRSNHGNRTAPTDRFHLVYCVFYTLGIGSLLPWNFFSNARQYFVFKMRNNISVPEEDWVDDPSQYNHFQAMFVPYLSMAAMIPNVLFMFLNTAVTKVMPLKRRIVTATSAMIAMFALTIILTKINTDSWQTVFFGVTMATIVIMNAGSAVLQGGVFGLAGMFPKEYTQSVMGGMGLGGVTAAVANIMSIWLSTGPMDSGFGYFMTAELVVVIALMGYLSLNFLSFSRYYMESSPNYARINVDDSEDGEVSIRRGHSSMLQIFKKIWVYALGVFMVFLVTLSCYPAINSRIFSSKRSIDHPSLWADKFFIPVTCFLLFNVWDLIGRTVAGPIQWPRPNSVLIPIFCVARVLFIPIFMFCNILPRHHLTTYFTSDYVPIVTMVFFGVSNGYLSTLCMMYGPRLVEPENTEMAGAMMSFFLSLGLGVGSALSFLLITIA